jgi:ribosomal protein S18 acetylase RimI-like enzyme
VTEASGPRVRTATEADLPALAALHDELSAFQRDWRVFEPRPAGREHALERYRSAMSRPVARMFVAEDGGGGVVGMAMAAEVVPSTHSDERAVELSSVVVASDHRGRGVGLALTAAAAAFARERGVRRVVVRVFTANPALGFWEAAGFEPRFLQLTGEPDEILRHVDPGRE